MEVDQGASLQFSGPKLGQEGEDVAGEALIVVASGVEEEEDLEVEVGIEEEEVVTEEEGEDLVEDKSICGGEPKCCTSGKKMSVSVGFFLFGEIHDSLP